MSEVMQLVYGVAPPCCIHFAGGQWRRMSKKDVDEMGRIEKLYESQPLEFRNGKGWYPIGYDENFRARK